MSDTYAVHNGLNELAGAQVGGSIMPATLGEGNLRPALFIADVAKLVDQHFAEKDKRFNNRVRSRLAQFWFGSDSSIHYELWLHERTGQLEIGLHFEATQERNMAFYRSFDRCLLEVQALLGNRVWLEEWDKGWTRLYETHPLWPLDAAQVEAIAVRMCTFIEAVQPLFEHVRSQLSSGRLATP